MVRPIRSYPRSAALLVGAGLAFLVSRAATSSPEPFRFVVLGDRTGDAQPGVYEHIWTEIGIDNPAFVLGVGDTIEGLSDERAERQWREFEQIRDRFRRFPLYLAPGNHDIWSEASESLFLKHTGHPAHYSFDYRQVHVTVLDNSRDDQFPSAEMAFLKKDLQAHAAQPVKIIVSHRPSWLVPVLLRDTRSDLHVLAKQFGVQFVIAGHVHQMLHFEREGIAYISAPSSGGHLRGSKEYADGWLFGYMRGRVRGDEVSFEIREADAPHGLGRVSALGQWGGLREAAGKPSARKVNFLY